MADLRQTIIRGGLELLFFTGAHLALKPLVGGVGAILTLHHVRPPRPDSLPAQPHPRSHAALSHPRGQTAAPLGRRRDQPRRDAPPPDRARFRPPLRLPHLRRRLSRQAAIRLSDPQARRDARSRSMCRPSFPDRLGELWWLALEAVIAKQRAHRACHRRREPHLRLRYRRGEARALRRALLVAAAPADRSRAARHRARSRRLLCGRHRRVLQGSVHGLAGDRRSSPPIRW